MSIKVSAQFSGHTLGSQLFPVLKRGCFSDWVETMKEIIMGLLNLELAGKHWGAVGAVPHQTCCCMRDSSTLGCKGITGPFLKHRHLISLQLIDFNGVCSFNFYSGVRESRVWLEATIVLCWLMEWVQCAESNPLQGRFKFCHTQTLVCESRFLILAIPPQRAGPVCRATWTNEQSGGLFPIPVPVFLPALSPCWALPVDKIPCVVKRFLTRPMLVLSRVIKTKQKEWAKLSFLCRRPASGSWLVVTRSDCSSGGSSLGFQRSSSSGLWQEKFSPCCRPPEFPPLNTDQRGLKR